MPTYTKIKFIKDKIEGRRLRKGLIWNILFKEGEVCNMNIRKATEFVKDGYAIFI